MAGGEFSKVEVVARGRTSAEMLRSAPRMSVAFMGLKMIVNAKVDAVNPTTGKTTKVLEEKTILKGIDGVLKPARLTAVMGSSGAGKTTFLNVLVSRTPLLPSPLSPSPAPQCAAVRWRRVPELISLLLLPTAAHHSSAQAGFASAGGKVEGSISVNGVPVTPAKMRQISGYVHQEVCAALLRRLR